MSVPKLRFPEFRDAGEWEVAMIGDFVDSYKGGAPLTPSDFIIHSNYEVIPKKAIIEGGWLKLDVNQPTYCKESFYKENLKSVVDSTYLITTLRDLVPSGPSIGYIVKFEGNKNYILAQGVYGLKLNQAIIPEFLIHFSNTQKYRKIMQSLMVGSTQVHIRNNVFLNLIINIPSLPEQQKIADCLTSLADRITAESQKLDTLKAHKKGLMQQLFPAEGETLPKLRFSEFQDSGEWEVKKLEEVCDCIVPGRDKPKSFTGDIPWITIPDIQGLKIHSSINKLGLSVHEIKECGAKIVPKNSVIMSCVGTFGLVSICDQDLVINQQLHAWIPSPKVNNYYLAYSLILQKEQMERMATNTTIAYLNKSSCNAITIPLPSLPEQQKIVDCLSFLDEAIAAQSQAIELLKLHKKGLMQQLFPSVEEVTG
jgi:type I restriction enzyme S subunit